MIPLRDANPTSRTPWVTLGLIAANVVAFFLWEPITGTREEQQLFFVCEGAIPRELSGFEALRETQELCGGKSFLVSLFSSMFLHADFLHIGFNMLYLWVFGNNVEDRMGKVPVLLFYLLAGIAAAYAQVVPDPDSLTPLVGASGAIAGALGAYLVMFPSARVLTLIPIFFFIQLMEIPAIFLLGFWFVLQAFQGVGTIGAETGVAWFAHIGGFVFGAGVALLFYRGRRSAAQTWGY